VAGLSYRPAYLWHQALLCGVARILDRVQGWPRAERAPSSPASNPSAGRPGACP